MTKDKEKSLNKYVSTLEDRLQAAKRGVLSDKHVKYNSAATLKQFLEREISAAKASIAKAKGI